MEHARDSLGAVAHPDKCLCGRAGRALHEVRDVQVLMRSFAGIKHVTTTGLIFTHALLMQASHAGGGDGGQRAIDARAAGA